MKDKKLGIGLGIGFWTGMAVMNLINFLGSIIFVDNNYYVMRYALVMFFISIIFTIIGLIYLKNYNQRNKK